MPSFLSKVFGRKKDALDKEHDNTLLDGKFEAVSPNVSPSATNFPELNGGKTNGHAKDKEPSGFNALFRAKSRPPYSSENSQKKTTEPVPLLSLSLNLPDATKDAEALGVVFEGGADAQVLFSDSVIGEKRLSPTETLDLVRACAHAMTARGLESLGIMHPHWYSASPDIQRRLISLFLHSLSPTPSSPGSLISSPRDTFSSELDSTRSSHDVAAVLRWGLRHLELGTSSSPASFGKSPEWYSEFSTAESAAGYPSNAFSEYLTPLLPEVNLELLTETLGILSSLAPHAETNSTSGSKLSKLFGLWLLISPRTQPEDDWKVFYERWEKMGRILEHLFLAHIRDEAVSQRLPIRLLELVHSYPYSKDPSSDGLLPRPRFSTRRYDALFVRIETELPSSSSKEQKTKQHPLKIISTAFSAPVTSEGEYTGLWTQIRSVAAAPGSSPTGNEQTPPELSQVFADETIRFLSLLPQESYSKGKNSEPLSSPTFSIFAPGSTTRSPTIVRRRSSSDKLPPSSSSAAAARANGHSKPATDPSPISPSPYSSGADSIASDWAQFSTSGFWDGSSTNTTPLASTLWEKENEFVEVTNPPRTSVASPRRKMSRNGRRSVDVPRSATAETKDVKDDLKEETSKSISKTTLVSLVQLDESFVDFWSDALTDLISRDWPHFVICKLKASSPSLASLTALAAEGEEQQQKKIEWLILEQIFTTPPPPPPPAPGPEATARPRPSSPRPSYKSETLKRFSFFTGSSSGRTQSSSSVASAKGKEKEKKPRGGAAKVGEMGEILAEVDESAEAGQKKKEATVKIKIPTPKMKKSLVDLRGKKEKEAVVLKVPEKEKEVVPEVPKVKEEAEGPSPKTVAAVTTGAVVAGAVAALAIALPEVPSTKEGGKSEGAEPVSAPPVVGPAVSVPIEASPQGEPKTLSESSETIHKAESAPVGDLSTLSGALVEPRSAPVKEAAQFPASVLEPAEAAEPVSEPLVESPSNANELAAAMTQVIEQPHIDEPLVGEPAAIEPALENQEPAAVEDPAAEESATVRELSVEGHVAIEEPVLEERVIVEEATIEEPATVEEPAVDESAVDEQAVEEQAIEEPAVIAELTIQEPAAVVEPASEPAAMKEPMEPVAVEEPVAGKHMVAEEPAVEKYAYIEVPAVHALALVEEPEVQEPIATDEPAVEEPIAVEEPAIELSATVKVPATVEEPATEQSLSVEESAAQDPIVEEPRVEEATVEELVVEEPAVEEPAVEEPAVDGPAVDEPVIEESSAEDPLTVEEPAVDEPVVEEPAVIEQLPAEEPVADEEPAVVEPIFVVEPVVEKSATVGEPVLQEATVFEEPALEDPVGVEESPVEGSATEAREVEKPSVIEEPSAEQPTVVEEPAVEESLVNEEPTAQESTVDEEPAIEESLAVEKPMAEETGAVEEPVVEDPTIIEEPAVKGPAVEGPIVVKELVVEESFVVEEPSIVPVAVESAAEEVPIAEAPTEAVVEEPAVEEHVAVEESAIVDPIMEDSVVVEETMLEEPMAVVEESVMKETVVVEESAAKETVVEQSAAAEQPTVESAVVEQHAVEEPFSIEELAVKESATVEDLPSEAIAVQMPAEEPAVIEEPVVEDIVAIDEPAVEGLNIVEQPMPGEHTVNKAVVIEEPAVEGLAVVEESAVQVPAPALVTTEEPSAEESSIVEKAVVDEPTADEQITKEPAVVAEVNTSSPEIDATSPTTIQIVAPTPPITSSIEEPVYELVATSRAPGPDYVVDEVPLAEDAPLKPPGLESPSEELPTIGDLESVNVVSAVPRIEPLATELPTSVDVDLPAVPIVEADEVVADVRSPETHITIPLAKDYSPEASPDAQASEPVNEPTDEIQDLSPAPENVIISGSTPGPEVALSTNEQGLRAIAEASAHIAGADAHSAAEPSAVDLTTSAINGDHPRKAGAQEIIGVAELPASEALITNIESTENEN